MSPANDVHHLYAHIPFCPSKCGYCAFETHIGSLRLVPAYLDALRREIVGRLRERPTGHVDTVYFGGGTPSMLQPCQVGSVLDGIRGVTHLAAGAEITLEAHPDTVSREKLEGFRRVGVTRLSMGVESLDAPELEEVGRSYSPERVLELVQGARRAGFESVALDLIYGLPGQTVESWTSTLRRAIDSGVDHLSLYPLSVEPRTPFARRQREGRLVVPEDESVVEMYAVACELTASAGLEHYEVANWAVPGHQCRHNLAYWRAEEYYGTGVGAHSYLKPWRTANVRGTGRYIRRVVARDDPVDAREMVGGEAELEEWIILRLRLLRDGLDLPATSGRFALDFAASRRDAIASLRENGLVRLDGRRLLLEERAVPVANEVWERLM